MNLADSFSVFEQKFFLILNMVFPGLFVLETVFQVGLFSGGITNLFEFILFLFWAVALSMPYLIMSAHQLNLDKKMGMPRGKSIGEWVGLAIKFPLNVAGAVVTAFSYKLLVHLKCFQSVDLVIPAQQLRYIAALGISFLFGYLLALGYWKLLQVSVLSDSIKTIREATGKTHGKNATQGEDASQ